MLKLLRLRVLAAVAEHGSVTAAAEALSYAQPSVSHHLARLQAETGAVLVRRVGRGIRLTPEGERLAQRATEILGRVEAAEDELASLTGLRSGRVRVAAPQSVLSAWLPAAAAALREQHPGLELQLADAHPEAALALLREGDVDVAVVFRHGGDAPDDGVRYRHLVDDPVYLLSLRTGDTVEDHRDTPWIAGCRHCSSDLTRTCESAGFTPRIAYTSDDIVVQQQLVGAGLGVTTMPGLALQVFRASGIHATEMPNNHRRVYVATYGDPPDPPGQAAFIAALNRTVPYQTDADPSPLRAPDA